MATRSPLMRRFIGMRSTEARELCCMRTCSAACRPSMRTGSSNHTESTQMFGVLPASSGTKNHWIEESGGEASADSPCVEACRSLKT